jgi:inosine-uridine nucleoside N-ribohydrolase
MRHLTLILLFALQTITATAQKQQVWLDADTGNEMDDLYAIVRLVQDPTIQLVGLSSAHFNNPDLRTFSKWNGYDTQNLQPVAESQRLNELIINALGRPTLPHPIGADRQIGFAWGRQDPRDSPAAQGIIAAARALPKGQYLDILTLGPLTNVASALQLAPDIKSRIRCYSLGAKYDPIRRVWNKSEFNIRNDLNAFDYVLDLEGLDLTVMPLEAALPLQFGREATYAQLDNNIAIERILADRWREHNPQDPTRIMWDLALVAAYLNPLHAHIKTTSTPPENLQRTIKVYTQINAQALEDDFWRTLKSGTHSAPKNIAVPSKNQVQRYDYQEVTFRVVAPDARINPFKAVRLNATFSHEDGTSQTVEGFCDSQEGSVFRVRYMPVKTGRYTYEATFDYNGTTERAKGAFEVIASTRKGPLRLDKTNPWHFVYDNGDHYFWNSTTAYWMLGLRDESEITRSIDRLAGYGINRIRVAINGRAHGGIRWNEPTVVESPEFTLRLDPWVAERPGDLDAPNFNVTQLNIAHWQKMDRLIAHCRERGIVVSFIFYVDGLDHACDPFKRERMGQEDEQMYYAYAAARYAAYENVMWDIANEYHLFRTPEWAEKMGSYLKQKDPYNHLISVHGSSDFPFRRSPWVDVVMYQSWDECGGYEFMMESRQLQAATGRILPTINEEYGYEDTYPPWGCGATASKAAPDGRSAINRSQLAWEICMTGSYQTTGETAAFGTGAGAGTGGGWVNGRGNDSMTMLKYYKIMKETFEQTRYWELAPRPDLVNAGNMCLANEGKEYLIYTRLQHCRVKLPAGQRYSVTMIDPLTGAARALPDADADIDNYGWQYRYNLAGHWVFLLKRK